jgi:hypothetical protein
MAVRVEGAGRVGRSLKVMVLMLAKAVRAGEAGRVERTASAS